MLTTLLIFAGFAAHAAFDVKAIHHERIFQLDYNGHRSHLFVVDNIPRDPRLFEMTFARAAMTSACSLVLAARPEMPERVTAPTAPLRLHRHLSRTARDAMIQLGLGELLSPDRKVEIGDAWRAVRTQWQAHLNHSFRRYQASLGSPGALEISRRTKFDELLHNMAAPLWRETEGSFTDRSLAERAMEHMVAVQERSARHPSRRFEDEMHLRGREKPLLLLHDPTSAPQSPDLEEVLLYLDTQLDRSDESTYLHHFVAEAMSQKLAEDYFAMDPIPYETSREILDETGLMLFSYFPGEDSLRRHDENAHEAWIDPIMHALAAGSTFLSIDPKYVLPLFQSDRRASLLTMLEERGVSITPIRPRPRIVRGI